MAQAAAAARALQREADDIHLRRALETALAVSYARAFTRSTLLTLCRDVYRPTDAVLAEVHDTLLRLRDQVYAHTDKASGRKPTMTTTATEIKEGDEGETVIAIDMHFHEEWLPFPPEAIPHALRLFSLQRERLLKEAAHRQHSLDLIAATQRRTV